MRIFACLIAGAFGVTVSPAQIDVLTANYDNNRTNSNQNETVLTQSNVTPSQFGRVFALAVDGSIYAQPLYVSKLKLPRGDVHNVVFVSTMHNSLFAFDADVWNGKPLWVTNFGPPVPTGRYNAYFDVFKEIGILSTPVIDAVAQTIYAVSAHYDSGTFSHRLHALDLLTGQERLGSPVTIEASVKGIGYGGGNGTVTFDSAQHLQRPGLLLANGQVYAAFGSHADEDPYHGWIFAYDAGNVSHQTALLCTTPNGKQGSIWQSGRGLAADANGFIYAATANGDYDAVSNWSEALLKLKPDLTVADWFAPDNWMQLNGGDLDLGAAGVAFIPGTDLLLGGGKYGTNFVTHASSLGHTQVGNGQIVQALSVASHGMFDMAVWNGPAGTVLFVENGARAIDGYKGTNGVFETTSSLRSTLSVGTIFEGISVSSNGAKPGTGIVWVTSGDSYGFTVPGVLLAMNAEDPSKLLWSSKMNPDDALGYFAKFVPPTVANGKVYVPTFSNEVVVYGLTNPSAVAPQITTLVNAASYAGGAIAPGEIVTVFGAGLGPAQLSAAQPDNGLIDAELADTEVLFNGVPAPVLYTSATAVSAIVPFNVNEQAVTVQVMYKGTTSSPYFADVQAALPGLFSLDASGAGPGAILNQDLSLNGSTNPAKRGQTLVLYGTGSGSLNPAPDADGVIVAADDLMIAQPVTVSIGGVPAQVTYAGAAPGSVAGLFQINAVIPANVTPGNSVPIVISVGDVASQNGITVAIQ